MATYLVTLQNLVVGYLKALKMADDAQRPQFRENLRVLIGANPIVKNFLKWALAGGFPVTPEPTGPVPLTGTWKVEMDQAIVITLESTVPGLKVYPDIEQKALPSANNRTQYTL